VRVELVSTGFASGGGAGPERYSSELLRGLRSRGLDARGVSSSAPRVRYALAVNSVARLPPGVLANLGGVDLVHALDPSSAMALPFLGHPTVATIHDLMPYLLRGAYYGAGDRMFSLLAYRAASRCDAVVAVSQQTKAEVEHYLRVAPSKVRVVPHGVSDEFRVMPDVSKEPFTVGYVGDINPRKRLDFLLQAFALVKRSFPAAKLMLVGTNVARFLDSEKTRVLRVARELGVEQDLVATGRVPELELVRLYNRMRVLVQPSDYEGFGFPILEAERCGTPAIVRADARISPEVSAACLKVAAPEDLSQAIGRLFSDSEFFSEAAEKAREHAAQFTWARCVSETLAVYASLLR
jgi:glycosyltransferase involved in cell wall biosynthesis